MTRKFWNLRKSVFWIFFDLQNSKNGFKEKLLYFRVSTRINLQRLTKHFEKFASTFQKALWRSKKNWKENCSLRKALAIFLWMLLIIIHFLCVFDERLEELHTRNYKIHWVGANQKVCVVKTCTAAEQKLWWRAKFLVFISDAIEESAQTCW